MLRRESDKKNAISDQHWLRNKKKNFIWKLIYLIYWQNLYLFFQYKVIFCWVFNEWHSLTKPNW